MRNEGRGRAVLIITERKVHATGVLLRLKGVQVHHRERAPGGHCVLPRPVHRPQLGHDEARERLAEHGVCVRKALDGAEPEDLDVAGQEGEDVRLDLPAAKKACGVRIEQCERGRAEGGRGITISASRTSCGGTTQPGFSWPSTWIGTRRTETEESEAMDCWLLCEGGERRMVMGRPMRWAAKEPKSCKCRPHPSAADACRPGLPTSVRKCGLGLKLA